MKYLLASLLLLYSINAKQEDALPIFDLCYEVSQIPMSCKDISLAIAKTYTKDNKTNVQLYALCYRICKDPNGFSKARPNIIKRLKGNN